jgi:hypothetical protein
MSRLWPPSILFVGLNIDNPLKSLILILFSEPAFALDGFSFYFLGQNIKSFQNSNWMEVAVGALASICIHELGHAIYLEAGGNPGILMLPFHPDLRSAPMRV